MKKFDFTLPFPFDTKLRLSSGNFPAIPNLMMSSNITFFQFSSFITFSIRSLQSFGRVQTYLECGKCLILKYICFIDGFDAASKITKTKQYYINILSGSTNDFFPSYQTINCGSNKARICFYYANV